MGRPVLGSIFGDPTLGPGELGWDPGRDPGCDPGWDPNGPLGLSGAFGLNGPGDFRLGVTGGVPIFPVSAMLFCLVSMGGLLDSPFRGAPPGGASFLCGEGGAEPCGFIMGGPCCSAPPRARCI